MNTNTCVNYSFLTLSPPPPLFGIYSVVRRICVCEHSQPIWKCHLHPNCTFLYNKTILEFHMNTNTCVNYSFLSLSPPPPHIRNI